MIAIWIVVCLIVLLMFVYMRMDRETYSTPIPTSIEVTVTPTAILDINAMTVERYRGTQLKESKPVSDLTKATTLSFSAQANEDFIGEHTFVLKYTTLSNTTMTELSRFNTTVQKSDMSVPLSNIRMYTALSQPSQPNVLTTSFGNGILYKNMSPVDDIKSNYYAGGIDTILMSSNDLLYNGDKSFYIFMTNEIDKSLAIYNASTQNKIYESAITPDKQASNRGKVLQLVLRRYSSYFLAIGNYKATLELRFEGSNSAIVTLSTFQIFGAGHSLTISLSTEGKLIAQIKDNNLVRNSYVLIEPPPPPTPT